ncbi:MULTISPECIES: hypothetical protein [unclassified Mycobacterium]|uniref:hypothetical protein n=1 Tax=unclassified Mycobacterium TaxID=2642494 RepID=UPI0029C95CD1|nr:MULTISPECIES: hypothetical protein [unclassified Mycobacterium]
MASGAVHLVVGVGRRNVAGHWPMILSGSISVLAGVSFYLGSLDPVPSLQKICGYALGWTVLLGVRPALAIRLEERVASEPVGDAAATS